MTKFIDKINDILIKKKIRKKTRLNGFSGHGTTGQSGITGYTGMSGYTGISEKDAEAFKRLIPIWGD